MTVHTMTTRQSASLVPQDEVKRGSFHPETKAPTMGGAESPTAKSGFFTTTRPLLVELLCEELPPKALHALGLAFAQAVRDGLAAHGLLAPDCMVQDFATPRRLALRLTHVLAQAASRPFTEKLMPATVGLTAEGTFTAALIKKLRAKGLAHVTPADLVRVSDGKQDVLTVQGTAAGATLTNTLQDVLEQAITSLPIPKVMRYQLADGTSVKFVRPVHALTVLWGDSVIPVKALGLSAGNTTQGHRFLGASHITLRDANAYEQQLFDEGKVVAAYAGRRQDILTQLQHHAQTLGTSLGAQDEVDTLLDEVTALVELPAVYVGQFDPAFLDIPQECLILTMRLNQKYFPLFDAQTGKLTHRFLIVSNMRIADPGNIIEGNARVVRPRLADAQFFYQTDRKTALIDRVESLQTRIYHHKLGTQRERVERVRALARHIAQQIAAAQTEVDHGPEREPCLSRQGRAGQYDDGAEGSPKLGQGGSDCQVGVLHCAALQEQADRAALLAKADLNTLMVGEFAQLQGVMGAYYAQSDGEVQSVVTAIRNQYRNRLDAPVAADTLVAAILFMAERLETLVGIWGIGLAPTGERDPYGLRRAALGLISAYVQLQAGGYLPAASHALDIVALLRFTLAQFKPEVLAADTPDAVHAFINERYRYLLNAQQPDARQRQMVDAVLAVSPPLHQVPLRVAACAAFAQLPQAASLAAANKRIGNLLKKVGDTIPAAINERLLTQDAERALAATVQRLAPIAQQHYAAGEFSANLAILAQVGDAVDAFFTHVMVMADDAAVRANRLALLGALHRLMNQVADLARLDV